MMLKAYGFGIDVNLDLPTALERAIEFLRRHGFRVVSNFDVAGMLDDEGGGHDFPAYYVLGVCCPALAAESLRIEPDAGLLAPCAVIVYARGRGCSRVVVLDPEKRALLTGNRRLRPLVTMAKSRLAEALVDLADWAEAPRLPGARLPHRTGS